MSTSWVSIISTISQIYFPLTHFLRNFLHLCTADALSKFNQVSVTNRGTFIATQNHEEKQQQKSFLHSENYFLLSFWWKFIAMSKERRKTYALVWFKTFLFTNDFCSSFFMVSVIINYSCLTNMLQSIIRARNIYGRIYLK